MPDREQSEPAADAETTAARADIPIFSAYGVASAVLGVVSVAAIVLGVIIWTTHRDDVNDRRYQSRVLKTAADWTGALINMNTDNIDDSLQRLHDGTVGELNADFDSAIAPYRQVVQRLKSRSTGRTEAVAIESVHHQLDEGPGSRPPAEPLPAEMAKRTDNVMVVATSISENVGGKPQIVHWNLRLAVSDVDGKLVISRLESVR